MHEQDSQSSSASFDFDAWADLARRDPDDFERRRQQVIEQAIDRAPLRRQARLRRLQWRIDQTRRLAPTPLSACIQLQGMMWDKVTGPAGLLAALRSLDTLTTGRAAPPRPPPAAVLHLPDPRSRRLP